MAGRTPTLLIVAGPSCAGKSPLVSAFRRLHADLAAPFRSPVLYHSRKPRPGERDGEDYHFRTRKEIKALRERDDFSVFKVRGELQAVDWGGFDLLLEGGDVLYEGNVETALAMRERVQARAAARVVDTFLSPLALGEVRRLGGHPGFAGQLVEMNRRRLLRRAYAKAAHLSLPDLEEIEARARTVPEELAAAPAFSCVIPCHDGEDSDHWTLFAEPVGDAGSALAALVSLVRGTPDATVERWPPDALPGG